MGLLVPADSDLAKFTVIPRTALANLRIAVLSGEHGKAVVDPVFDFFSENGAVQMTIEEGNAHAIERYAQRNHCCALGIGWFSLLDGMVWREVEGMTFHFDLALVLGTGANNAALRFFEFAKTFQAAQSDSASLPDATRHQSTVSGFKTIVTLR